MEEIRGGCEDNGSGGGIRWRGKDWVIIKVEEWKR